jgi:hypothetical protein
MNAMAKGTPTPAPIAMSLLGSVVRRRDGGVVLGLFPEDVDGGCDAKVVLRLPPEAVGAVAIP